MKPFTRHAGPWTIVHSPAGHSAYDRVLGRISAWSLEVAHETGWRIVEHEGEHTATVYTPGGLLVGVIDPDVIAHDHRPTMTSGRSGLLADALTRWVHDHADEFDESDIVDL
ncbi:MAG: hypothetical protein WCP95_01815 [Actinomycetes bacterium]